MCVADLLQVAYDIEANSSPQCQELYDLISSTHVNVCCENDSIP